MKDSDRLNLLKDISGASFYEKQRDDSIQMLEETNQKCQSISETIDILMN
jgi:structural maintenance of chromosome 3 (chondroitin sulfate proteoglycan 6)